MKSVIRLAARTTFNPTAPPNGARRYRFRITSPNERVAPHLRYSAVAVIESKKQMNSNDTIHKPIVGRLQLAMMRSAMRIVNAVPLLKRRVIQNIMRVRGEN